MVVTDRNGAKSPMVTVRVTFVGTNSHAPLLRVSRKLKSVPLSRTYFLAC